MPRNQTPRVLGLFSVSVSVGKADEVGDAFYFAESPEGGPPIIAGGSTELRCRASPEDGIAYTWQLDGQPVPNTTRRFQRGSNLIIRRVDPERDAGEFKCTATNMSTGFSLASGPASLRILCESLSFYVPENKGESILPPLFSSRFRVEAVL
ncbi:hypothetical protein J437_LFUL004600 [Ladona fulva]|uniref:Ig-like domain-containing protein n=1 Tax=Ladona fulva TaxID=123851 RepID=A0A8K0JZ74_LADFU|nr:hypothetical protein J437_LFUL004600 [Ladona fulva]